MEKTTHFERAIFFSWYCKLRDCKFCFMSTQKENKAAKRTMASILAEVLICKKLGWKIGFLSGGVEAFNESDFFSILTNIVNVYRDKIWINIGPIRKDLLVKYKPYIKGVVGSIETVNEKIHNKVCPSKPTKPYLDMFRTANELDIDCAMTIILGLGETIDDFPNLKAMIAEYNIKKIHLYGLNPHKGTVFENSNLPTADYQAEWIAKTRAAFPKIDIQLGIWEDRVDRVAQLLVAGANSISKFPAIKYFGKSSAIELENQARQANRTFKGTLTKMPNIDWEIEINELEITQDLKDEIKIKLQKYLKTMNKGR